MPHHSEHAAPPSIGSVLLPVVAGLLFVGGLVGVGLYARSMDGGSSDEIQAQSARLDRLVAEDRVKAYQQCVQGYQAVARFNTLMDTLATQQERIVVEAPPGTRPNQAERAKIYRAAMTEITPETCGKPPPGAN